MQLEDNLNEEKYWVFINLHTEYLTFIFRLITVYWAVFAIRLVKIIYLQVITYFWLGNDSFILLISIYLGTVFIQSKISVQIL